MEMLLADAVQRVEVDQICELFDESDEIRDYFMEYYAGVNVSGSGGALLREDASDADDDDVDEDDSADELQHDGKFYCPDRDKVERMMRYQEKHFNKCDNGTHSCWRKFNVAKDELAQMALSFKALPQKERRLFLQGLLMGHYMKEGDQYCNPLIDSRSSIMSHKSGSGTLSRRNHKYFIYHRDVCRNCLFGVFGISKKSIETLKKTLEDHFMTVCRPFESRGGAVKTLCRSNGASSNEGNNLQALIKKYSDPRLKKAYIVSFMYEYANRHGLPTPDCRGTLNCTKAMKDRWGDELDTVIIKLPIAHTMRVVYDAYVKALGEEIADASSEMLGIFRQSFDDEPDQCSTSSEVLLKGAASFSWFRRIWKKDTPYIMTTRRGSDFCDTCTSFRKADYQPHELYVEHRRMAQNERQYYLQQIEKARNDSTEYHLSFDYAQAVSLPHLAQQPGTFYFQVQRKVPLFGISVEAERKQFNFVHMEGEVTDDVGKGSDSIITPLHYVINQSIPASVTKLRIHADNCPGQGKNNYILVYLLYILILGEFTEIELSFMLAGHTKFAPDAGFGQIKRKFRREDVLTVEELVTLINNSSAANTAILCSELQFFAWREYLKQFFKDKVVEDIASKHNFLLKLEDGTPVITSRKLSSDEYCSDRINVLKPGVSLDDVRSEDHGTPSSRFKSLSQFSIQIKGLTRARANYLYEKYNEYYQNDEEKLNSFVPEYYFYQEEDERLKVQHKERYNELLKMHGSAVERLAKTLGIKCQTSDSKTDQIMHILIREEEEAQKTPEEVAIETTRAIVKRLGSMSLAEVKKKFDELGLVVETEPLKSGKGCKKPTKAQMLKAISEALLAADQVSSV